MKIIIFTYAEKVKAWIDQWEIWKEICKELILMENKISKRNRIKVNSKSKIKVNKKNKMITNNKIKANNKLKTKISSRINNQTTSHNKIKTMIIKRIISRIMMNRVDIFSYISFCLFM